MPSRSVHIALSVLCVLCAAGIGMAVRDIAFDLTEDPAQARSLGFAAGAAVLGAFVLVLLLSRGRKP